MKISSVEAIVENSSVETIVHIFAVEAMLKIFSVKTIVKIFFFGGHRKDLLCEGHSICFSV